MPREYAEMKGRALILINKAIGYCVYGYAASSEINSVMYGPIISASDLDDMGDWY